MIDDKITKETMEIFPYCQECQHEWETHTVDGCVHEYCSCPCWRNCEVTLQ